jgi:hypothetical protein
MVEIGLPAQGIKITNLFGPKRVRILAPRRLERKKTPGVPPARRF